MRLIDPIQILREYCLVVIRKALDHYNKSAEGAGKLLRPHHIQNFAHKGLVPERVVAGLITTPENGGIFIQELYFIFPKATHLLLFMCYLGALSIL